MSKRTVTDLVNLQGKVVFVRVDFNVPLKNGEIQDDNRIVAALPTINHLVNQKARVVLFSHLGKVDHKDPEKCAADKAKNDMKFVAPRLSELLGQKVVYVPATRGEELEKAVHELKDGQVLLMQNTRYEKGESKNDPTYGVPELLNKAGKPTALGFLMQKEVEGLNRCVDITDANRPFVAILGGAKVSDKILVVEKLIEKADKVLIGGAITCTFLKALGKPVGNSRYEEDQLDFALKCVELAKAKNKLVLPIDHVVADDFAMPLDIRITNGVDIEDGFERLDIGPRTRNYYHDILQNAKTVFWNGPMGVFENPLFAEGTKSICETLTKLTREKGTFTVIGGGDSASAAAHMGYKDGFSHVSTGGGASLELIQNDGHLPGIDIIQDK